MHMGSWGLMSYHNLMGIYQNRKGMIRFLTMSHHYPMGRSIIKTFFPSPGSGLWHEHDAWR